MKFLRYNLWKTKRRLSPEAAFRRALWQQLAGAWGKRYVKISWYQAHLVRLASAGTIGVLVAGSFGTGAYAYVSPAVTEDSILYPVKQELEAVEERVLHRTPEAKAGFYLKQIARREAEAQVLAQHGRAPEQLEERLEKAEEKLVAIRIRLAVGANPRHQELQEKIETRLAARRDRLERQAVRLAEQLKKFESDDLGDADSRLEQTSVVAAVSTSLPKKREVKRLEQRDQREANIAERLKTVRERLEQLPRAASSTGVGPPLSPKLPGENIKIKLENPAERLERRFERLENKLEKEYHRNF